MIRITRLLLLATLACASALLAAENNPAEKPEASVTIHRCVDSKGHVTLQDDACPAGSQDSSRVMQRPKDAPISPLPPVPALAPEPEPIFEPAPPPPPPPPNMYVCTSYDGNERYSESYDPNPRCEPYVLYYPYPIDQPPQKLTCRWVEDSCVRLSNDAACAVWAEKRVQAASDAQRAFSDTAAYRKSELARISKIVNESCR